MIVGTADSIAYLHTKDTLPHANEKAGSGSEAGVVCSYVCYAALMAVLILISE